MTQMAARGRERSFGLSVGTVCALIAGLAAWRGHAAPARGFGLVAVGLLVPALARPSLLRLPSALWWRLAQAMGWVNSRVLLSVVFIGIVTPVSLVMRLGGWDPMRRRHRGRSRSSWTPYPERLRDPKHFDRMY